MEIDRIIEGDCLEELPKIDDNSIDAIVTDPPAAINFMQKSWDSDKGGRTQWIAWMSQVAAECLRVIKPGGHALVWALPRTSHWTGMAWEEAGWEPRDKIAHVFGCLSDDTEILIDGAWSHYRKCDIGCLTLCYNNETDSYSWQPIQEVFEYRIKDTAYRIQSDLTDQIVTRNHRCLIEREGKLLFCLAEEAVQGNQIRVPILESLHGLLKDLPLREPLSSGEESGVLSSLWWSPCQNNITDAKNTGCDLSELREDVSTEKQYIHKGCKILHSEMCCYSSLRESRRSRTDEENSVIGPGGMVGRDQEKLCSEDNRSGEPLLEGRRDLLQNARKLSGREICSLPSEISINGPERRLCDGTPLNSSAGNKAMPEEVRGCASYQPRPDRQPLRESSAFHDQPGPQEIRGAGITRTTLARIEPIDYEGIVWCVRVPTGAFVARRNGKIFVTGNSGFPKSLSIDKAIDRKRYDDVKPVCRFLSGALDKSGLKIKDVLLFLGFANDGDHGVTSWFREDHASPRVPKWDQWTKLKELLNFPDDMDGEVWRLNGRKGTPGDAFKDRKVVSSKRVMRNSSSWETEHGMLAEGEQNFDITKPFTPEAQTWAGWGSAIKPSHEDWWLFRKPLACKTIAENVLEWGCGGLNIDSCRISTNEVKTDAPYLYKGNNGNSMGAASERLRTNGGGTSSQLGRFPANLIWSHSPLCKRIGTKKVKGDGHYPKHKKTIGDGNIYGKAKPFDAEERFLNEEEVENWDCHPSCPSWEFAKAGESKARPAKAVLKGERSGKIKADYNGIYGRGLGDGGAKCGYLDTDASVARFFKSCQFSEEDIPAFVYMAKASKSDRGEGNTHCTTKPSSLIQYLCRLICPPNGIILDPFAGSGTLAIAAIRENFHYVCIEKEEEYIEIAKSRIAAELKKIGPKQLDLSESFKSD